MSAKPELDLFRYLPFYLRSISSRLNVIDSRLYVRSLGVGLNEWVCLALLAREDDISATRICEVSGYDKAVISRSISALTEKGLVTAKAVPDHNRRQLLRLTPSGQSKYREVEQRVLRRTEVLLADISAEERETLIELLSKILHSADALLQDGVENLTE